MLLLSLIYVTLFSFFGTVKSQSAAVTSAPASLNPASECHNSSATLSACNFVHSKLTACYSTNGAAFVACYCNQEYFNAIFECESEERLCFESNALDGEMLELAANWNSVCDKNITFTPTTPPVSVLTSTYSIAACAAATSACADGELKLSACSASYYTNATSYQSCICQPNIISLDYECEFQGNISCLERPGTISNLWPNSVCPNFSTVISQIQAQQNASTSSIASTYVPTTTSSAGQSTSLSVSTPVLPGSSSSTTPSPTSSSSAGQISKSWMVIFAWLGLIVVDLLM